MKELLHSLCPGLTDGQLDRFDRYYALLVDWNSRMNLTAITEKADVAKKHFLDSMAAAPYVPQGARLIDVGTGAGFPGVPLLILRPDIRLTLLDGLNKRILFLQALLQELGLSADTLHMRAEDAGRDPKLRERFDVATTRAVTRLPVLAELTLPLLKVGGVSIAYKGDPTAELLESASALRLLHGRAETVAIQADYGERTLVLMKKQTPTPKAYPRRAGTPEKTPL